MLRVILAYVHLLGLAIGFGAIVMRARALNRLNGPQALRTVFAADTAWGASALLFIASGLWRWLGGIEKPSQYYINNHIFLTKMGLLGLILLIEISPMIQLIRWRAASGRGTLAINELAVTGKRLARISDVQTLLLLIMMAAAVTMARGYGVPR